jgi:uncharacterized protein DUF4238
MKGEWSGLSPTTDTHIANMQWFVLDAWGAKDRLLTSDRPVMMTEGLGTDDSHIVMPISPTLLFLAVNNEATRRQISRLNKDQIVGINNQCVCEQAKKFVYPGENNGASGALIDSTAPAFASRTDNSRRDRRLARQCCSRGGHWESKSNISRFPSRS